MIESLSGRVVAVTGGARGIGRATAAALATAGAKVAIGDLDADLAHQTAGALGPEAAAFELDVTNRDSFARFLSATEERFGPLDGLVNNAGIMHVGRFLDEDEATALRQFEVNVHGVLLGMKLALPGMVARGRGSLVNVASIAGKGGFPGIATYTATKHAVVGMSEAVRAELRGTGVDVSVVLPSLVNTELASGTARSLVAPVEPEVVAMAIVAVLRSGKAEVFVPRAVGVLSALITPLPPFARAALARGLGAERVNMEADLTARAAYEARLARSAPALDPNDAR